MSPSVPALRNNAFADLPSPLPVVCAAVEQVAGKLMNMKTAELFSAAGLGRMWNYLLSDPQLRWIVRSACPSLGSRRRRANLLRFLQGPEKGVIRTQDRC